MKTKKLSFMIALTAFFVSCAPKETTLTFIETTDTHGRYDEFANDALVIKQMKAELGDKLILLDNGDDMQGTPFQYCSNQDAEYPNLVSEVLNYFPYDAVCVGNHDIEAGRKVFDRVYSETKMPVLAANVIDETTGEPYFTPYIIMDREGFKIAVLGLLTPYVVTWVPDRLRPGLRFEQLEAAAEKWVKIIQEKEHPDFLVGLFHSGFEPQVQNLPPDHPLGRENATKWVAENVPGFDLIFYGHDHRSRAEKLTNINGEPVYVLNSGNRAQGLAKAEVTLKKGEKTSISIELLPTNGEEKDSVYLNMLQPYLDRAENYQQEPVAELPVNINSDDAFKGPCLWVDEIHRCQFETVEAEGIHADISMAAPLGGGKTLEAGMLKVSDFFTWYPFENSLAVMSLTGKEVKAFLEYAYEMKSPIYNFDSGAGIIYEVTDKSPMDERINILSMADGTPFDMGKTYNVVMNSYRSMGGGNHLMNGLGWAQEEIKDHVVWQSDRDLRSLFIDWARKKGVLDNEPLNCWRIK
ncbi:MAG: bifunctional metallophosphatase/5'-nucleotidase [Bacteroidales bacterium]|nr:bifunctional metallophosphatase/5'-nucleotidase [Bacteroidales bacterium]